MLLATDQIGMKILLDPELAYSVPLATPPWGDADLPTGYSVCYSNYAQAVSSSNYSNTRRLSRVVLSWVSN